MLDSIIIFPNTDLQNAFSWVVESPFNLRFVVQSFFLCAVVESFRQVVEGKNGLISEDTPVANEPYYSCL